MKSRKLKRIVHSVKYFFKHNKNDILFVGGVVTEVAAVVTTAKATLKTKQMADEYASQLEQHIEKTEDTMAVRETKAEARRTIYRKVTGNTIKNYILPAALTVGSIGMYSKSHFNLKHELSVTSAALAAEHALNQKLLQNVNPTPEKKEETEEPVNAPYSGGIPNDLDTTILKNGVIVWDSETGYSAERDGYAEPTTIVLSPTCIKFEKSPYSLWEPNYDYNIDNIMKVMRDIVSHEISLYGFVNLNEIRKHFSTGRRYKIEEAENYYIAFDKDRHPDNQVNYRIYADCDANGRIIDGALYIDIFNTIVPKPGELTEAKRVAKALDPFKEE